MFIYMTTVSEYKITLDAVRIAPTLNKLPITPRISR